MTTVGNPPWQVAANAAAKVATLWMGDLEPWMDEPYLHSLLSSYLSEPTTTNLFQVKLIKDKNTMAGSAGYAFIEFRSLAAALHMLATLSGRIYEVQNLAENADATQTLQKIFKLNLSSSHSSSSKSSQEEPGWVIFVGDVMMDVTDIILLAHFQQKYKSCYAARVGIDHSGQSKGRKS